ncbi:MAG TPA: LemA family protein, partial [Steroidobacteraceae bacterium]
ASVVGLLMCAVLGISGCGYSSLQQQDEAVKTSWSEVVDQYQRRADLISSLADSVKSFAASEQRLIGMTAAGARSGTVSVTPAVLNDPAAFAGYQAMQDQLDRSLRALIGLAANYPQLQEDANFLDLRAQLAETQSHIAAARERYIEAVRVFNTTVRTFPTDLTARMFDFRPKPNLSAGPTAAR